MKTWITSVILISLFASQVYCQKVNKPTGSPVMTKLNKNNISTFFYNDGNSEVQPAGLSGTQYPVMSGLTAVYESGIVWGAKINGNLRVGGSTYSQGLQPGKILSPGVAEDPNLDKNRIYRVRSDVYPGSIPVNLNTEVVDEGFTLQEVRDRYIKDWNEWPAMDGAPFTDINNDGLYNPSIDIPGVKDAKQTIWYVANDLDAGKTTKLYGTQPMGIEFQTTIWNYDITEHHNNTIFKKYLLINKSNFLFTDMYISQWSDPDIGEAMDDFAGCDTMMNICYAYNSGNKDMMYGSIPPAVGYDLLQGPIVPGIAGQDRNRNGIDDASDYGYLNGRRVGPGKINLPMTASYYFARGDASVTDPTLGSVAGAMQFYNFMQGRIGLSGDFFFNPATGESTTYALSGDPITGTGWNDGLLLPPGDRRIGVASGPFNMAVSDTQ